MGIYHYTLRATPKKVRGVPLAQFKFAYKCGWGVERDPVVKRLLAAGDRAADKLRREGCKLAVQGDWYDGQPVYWFDALFGSFTEELVTTPRVGFLFKDEKGRWHIELTPDQELLNLYPEIGTLQTEQGLVYYVNRDGQPEQRFNMIYRAIGQVLIDRLIERSKRR